MTIATMQQAQQSWFVFVRHFRRSIRTVFWRVMFFYIGAIAVIGTLLPTDPEPAPAPPMSRCVRSVAGLRSCSPAWASAAAANVNAVILTSSWPAGNSRPVRGFLMRTRWLSKHRNSAISRATKVVYDFAMAVTTVTACGFLTAGFEDLHLAGQHRPSGIIMWLGINSQVTDVDEKSVDLFDDW